MVLAHIGQYAEPLLFLPAIGAVVWALVSARRRPSHLELDKEPHA